jgi:hypothetical protein
MMSPQWNIAAVKVATWLENVPCHSRPGAILLPWRQDGAIIAWLFDYDATGPSESMRRELAVLRQALQDAAVEELGFGFSPDGRAWSLVVRANQGHLRTEIGKAFYREMLADSLSKALLEAWLASHLDSSSRQKGPLSFRA